MIRRIFALPVAAAAAALVLTGCASGAESTPPVPSPTSAPAVSGAAACNTACEPVKLAFGEAWQLKTLTLTPELGTGSEAIPSFDGGADEQRPYMMITWHVQNNSQRVLTADMVRTDVYAEGQELSTYAYDALSSPDVLPGEQGDWVMTYQQQEPGATVRAEVTFAQPGSITTGAADAYFTGQYDPA